MFSRVLRRNVASAPSPSTNSLQDYDPNVSHTFRSFNSNKKNNNSSDGVDPQSSLQELQNALNRLDQLTTKFALVGKTILDALNSNDKNIKNDNNIDATDAKEEKKEEKVATAVSVREKKTSNQHKYEPHDDSEESVPGSREDNRKEQVHCSIPLKKSAMTATNNVGFLATEEQDHIQHHHRHQRRKSSSQSLEEAVTTQINYENAIFNMVDPKEEEEMVELIRRIAELVVLAERMAGRVLVEDNQRNRSSGSGDYSSSVRRDNGNTGCHGEMSIENDGKGKMESKIENSTSDGDGNVEKGDENGIQSNHDCEILKDKINNINHNNKNEDGYNDAAASPYLAIFELFCERNALANIVNIVTGVAFTQQKQIQRDDQSKDGTHMKVEDDVNDPYRRQMYTSTKTCILPPLTIATQAIQSVSILIQNVSRATSLYFLLSNNRVNDLIRLPIHLYKCAELNATYFMRHTTTATAATSKRVGAKGKQQSLNFTSLPTLPEPPTEKSLMNHTSPEISELTTHFVSFLKSLAMRINAETLQFYLSFPLMNHHQNLSTSRRRLSESNLLSKITRTAVLEANVLDEITKPPNAVSDDQSAASETPDKSSDKKQYTVSSLILKPPVTDEVEVTTAKKTDGSKDGSQPVTTDASHSTMSKDCNLDNKEENEVCEISPLSNDHLLSKLPVLDPNKPVNKTIISASELSVSATSNSAANFHLTPYEERKVVEFPLYERALEFCTLEGDSFVRVTAMNICMNIIRLATIPQKEVINTESTMKYVNDSNLDNSEERRTIEYDGTLHGSRDDTAAQLCLDSLPTVTPSGALHEAPSLPLQDRIAIAQYACDPRRVGDLISPLCQRLTSQFGQIEDTVRLLDELTNTSIAKLSLGKDQPIIFQKDVVTAKLEKKRSLIYSIHELVATVQDELLLLDDLLKVGLISLNEQAIEMMLATFIYPMLLQPLLLPLHRLSSSTIGERNRNDQTSNSSVFSSEQLSMSDVWPEITVQSPPPFTNICTNDLTVKNSASNETALQFSSITPPKLNDFTKSYSSHEMDLGPSKSALFGIVMIFQSVSNSTIRHLLLCALLHPFSPPASGGKVIKALPSITLPKIIGMNANEVSDVNREVEIRMEGNHVRQLTDGCTSHRIPVYYFGTHHSQENSFIETSTSIESSDNLCIFILAPALVDILLPEINTSSETYSSRKEDESSSLRCNPYRKILLSFLSGCREMVCLQQLVIAALHAAVSSVEACFVQEVMFALDAITPKDEQKDELIPSRVGVDNGKNERRDLGFIQNPPSGIQDFVKETIECLCLSIVNTSVTSDGWWKGKFNQVAARTLVDIVSGNYQCICLAGMLLTKLRLDAVKFLLSLPSRLDAKSRRASNLSSNKDHSKATSVDMQHLETWLLDRFYFDQPDKSSTSVIEHICYLKEYGEDEDSKSQYRYGLEVLATSSISEASTLLCEGTRMVQNLIVSEAKGNSPFHCAATWALSCLSLDAFCIKLSKLKGDIFNQSKNALSPCPLYPGKRKLSYISDITKNVEDCNSKDYSLAHISSKLAIALLDEDDTSPESQESAAIPPFGSVVELIGKAAFPCVCEVSPSFSPLFTGRSCVSNEGIKWQSLYLLIIGKWAVLAEPERGGTGGQGRVISACKLACLTIKKDTFVLTNNNTPARRLFMKHSSLDPRPPSLFLPDSPLTQRGCNLGPDGLRLTQSHMDLWFEDANAVGHAWKTLASKIAKARAKRGARIRSALLRNEDDVGHNNPISAMNLSLKIE